MAAAAGLHGSGAEVRAAGAARCQGGAEFRQGGVTPVAFTDAAGTGGGRLGSLAGGAWEVRA